MALSKKVTYDYDVRGEFKTISVREKTAIMEDGKELSSGYHRRVYSIGMSLEGIEDEATVKSLSSSLWTQEVSSSYSLLQTSQSLSL